MAHVWDRALPWIVMAWLTTIFSSSGPARHAGVMVVVIVAVTCWWALCRGSFPCVTIRGDRNSMQACRQIRSQTNGCWGGAQWA